MTVPTDMSIMDFSMDFLHGLFQRDDFNIKTEMDMDMSDFSQSHDDNFISDVWPSNPTNSDEFLDSILNDGGQLEGVLDPSPGSCSDSGLSNDNQDIEIGDQIIFGEDDDVLSSTMSSPGPSVSEAGGHSSPMHSDESASPTHQHSDIYQIPEVRHTQPVISIVPSVTLNQQNKTNVRMQTKPLQTVTILNQKNMQNAKLSGKVIRVQSMSGNPRSILLPVSVKDLRSIKIINATGKKGAQNLKINNFVQQPQVQQQPQTVKKTVTKKNVSIISQQIDETSSDNIDITGTSDDDIYDGSNSETSANSGGYPRLQLTLEEQRLLSKEGITLPTSYPLTKHEERELKRIRRKIRNKISAQDSRKRKKEYVDGLEDRVKQCTEENQTLLKRIKALQTQNQTLVSQLRRLQALVSRKMGNTTGTTGPSGMAVGKAQPATCLMVLLLSLALVAVPSLKRTTLANLANTDLSAVVGSDSDLETKMEEYVGQRTLLFKPEDSTDDDLNMEDLLTFHNENFDAPVTKKARFEPPTFEEPSLDEFPITEKFIHRKFIEPPVDDVWPPPTTKESPTGTTFTGTVGGGEKFNGSQSNNNNVVIVRIPEDK